jgi:heptosyltransferase III
MVGNWPVRRLLIRPGAIGDCILSSPALEYLASAHTEVWISSPVVPLVRFAATVRPLSSTGIDLLGIGDLEIPPLLKAMLESYDSVVSWYGENRPEFREALMRLRVNCTFHPALPPFGFAGHATDFFAEQVGAPRGLVPRIAVESARARESVVIQPFSGSPPKNWPLSCYRELAAKLPCNVEWTAGPEEELPEATRFTNLADLAAWLAGARLYIGNDSGITHLAAAVGVPTLALFGSSDPRTWAPRGENVFVLHAEPLYSLTVPEVLFIANRLLDAP